MGAAPTDSRAARDALIAISEAMHRSGRVLMQRVLPTSGIARAWQHYPDRDIVDRQSGARVFYHAHPPDARADRDHGHFHFFLARAKMPRRIAPLRAPPAGRLPRPSVVHIAALSIDADGLPGAWFATNRWVTDEWLYPADAIIAQLHPGMFVHAPGDPLVNRWLGAALNCATPVLADLLDRRDRRLREQAIDGEDCAVEVIASQQWDLLALLND